MPDMPSPVEPSLQGNDFNAAFDAPAVQGDPSADSPSGYVSDAELLAWLQSKSTRQNDALREQMNVSTNRQELIQELTDLKTDIEHARSPEEIDAIEGKMQALLQSEKYAPYADELGTLFNPTLAALQHPEGTDMIVVATDIATLADLKDRITSETAKLDKIDGLALVNIQQLVSDAKETQQLASNVLSSRDQTANSIVGNIRG